MALALAYPLVETEVDMVETFNYPAVCKCIGIWGDVFSRKYNKAMNDENNEKTSKALVIT